MHSVKILCIILFTFFLYHSQAQPISIVRADSVYKISPYLEFQKLEQFTDTPIKANWEKNADFFKNFGNTSQTHVVRFELDIKTKNVDLIVFIPYPTIDQIVFYAINNNYWTPLDTNGQAFTKDKLQRKYSGLAFKIPKGLEGKHTFGFKIKSGKQLVLPVEISSSDEILSKESDQHLISGIYFGIIFVMFLYNLFIFITVRDISYLFYIAYILSVGLTQAEMLGYFSTINIFNNPKLNVIGLQFWGIISGIFTTLFARNFIKTADFTPKFDKVLLFFIVCYLISFVLLILGYNNYSYNLINATAGPGVVILLSISVYIALKKQYRPAYFFMVAWAIFLLSIMLFVLKDIGVVPYNIFTANGLQIGSALEVVLLSFALADKINTFKKEKEISQQQALEASLENEKLVKEQNLVLEQKVHERTVALEHSNAELNNTLNNLKQAQTQLVESEKMASLGQLTAGIAHEVNNPINFVSSNIKPLKRDIDDVFAIIAAYEQKTKALDQHELALQMEKIKAEFDFNYLQNEINTLMKGIADGAERTVSIVRGLKNFSRIDEQDLKLANVHEGLDSTLTLLNSQLGNTIVLERNYGDIPMIDCFAGKLNQVFMNILVNSIQAVKSKFNNTEGGKIVISTVLKQYSIVISIQDNGIGMSPETKQKIFDPFYTTKEVGEGTGLGMSIVYNIMESHNGNITVDSTLNVGTTIQLEIPIKHVKINNAK